MVVVLAGGAIMSVAMGTRQSFGLYLEPLAGGYGHSLGLIAFAIALHNLTWGIAQPFAGAAADRFGPAPVVAAGALLYAGGLSLVALSASGAALILGMGVLVGLGISCTSFGVVMAALGRAVPAGRRSMAMGLASAGGSLGQALFVPLAQGVAQQSGMAASLLVLASCLVAAAPLGVLLHQAPGPGEMAEPSMPLREAVSQAFGHRGYCLLTLGFFTCGFQLAFIGTHLPAYLTLCGMPASAGASALALIGLFNMIGSALCGWLGGRFPQQWALGWLYLLRSAVILAFFLAPKTGPVVFAFAAAMGLMWLGTVPLTSGLVAKLFGTRHLGTLFGLCFLSHQVGSFLGSWSGGLIFDLTGSYSLVWVAAAMAGLVAAALHFPIDATSPHTSAAGPRRV
ncbi:MFS transporter [Pseudoroseomonas wenyumeiae]|uniref:MFS transporter n=2 Tax=Teichococcus wenyumeiae TaxID=2478470 RepID=A0A3A9JG87_9PROT|nr:MFS transporter [Pseudoroseomonas wenyumeiae]RMI20218.1 MFS transporter [Pseudoroseomonas wenyumeiae]